MRPVAWLVRPGRSARVTRSGVTTPASGSSAMARETLRGTTWLPPSSSAAPTGRTVRSRAKPAVIWRSTVRTNVCAIVAFTTITAKPMPRAIAVDDVRRAFVRVASAASRPAVGNRRRSGIASTATVGGITNGATSTMPANIAIVPVMPMALHSSPPPYWSPNQKSPPNSSPGRSSAAAMPSRPMPGRARIVAVPPWCCLDG